ncbi:hypothetical protein [Mycolicibacterium fortuitum]|nr:hypothetical protein [Mycolicibacterium fortuitum]
MTTALWVLVAVFAVGVVAGGLFRIRSWLQKPVPPEVIEAAHRDDDKDGWRHENRARNSLRRKRSGAGVANRSCRSR